MSDIVDETHATDSDSVAASITSIRRSLQAVGEHTWVFTGLAAISVIIFLGWSEIAFISASTTLGVPSGVLREGMSGFLPLAAAISFVSLLSGIIGFLIPKRIPIACAWIFCVSTVLLAITAVLIARLSVGPWQWYIFLLLSNVSAFVAAATAGVATNRVSQAIRHSDAEHAYDAFQLAMAYLLACGAHASLLGSSIPVGGFAKVELLELDQAEQRMPENGLRYVGQHEGLAYFISSASGQRNTYVIQSEDIEFMQIEVASAR